MKFSVNYYLFD